MLYWVVAESRSDTRSVLGSLASPDGAFLVPFAARIPVDVAIGDPITEARLALRSLFEAYVLPDGTLVDLWKRWWPSGIELLDLKLENNILIVDYSSEFLVVDDPTLDHARRAQVVFTATHLTQIDGVVFAIQGRPVDGGAVHTRADYVDLLPVLFLDTPAVSAVLSDNVDLRGTANSPDGRVHYEIHVNTELIASGVAEVSCGAKCRGEFGARVPLPDIAGPTPATATIFYVDAGGSRRATVSRPIIVKPSNQ